MIEIIPTSSDTGVKLTKLEIHTLFLHGNGMDIKTIAFQEGVSESAIKQRFKNLRSKLDARNNTQAVMKAFQEKIFKIVDTQDNPDAHPDITFMF